MNDRRGLPLGLLMSHSLIRASSPLSQLHMPLIAIVMGACTSAPNVVESTLPARVSAAASSVPPYTIRETLITRYAVPEDVAQTAIELYEANSTESIESAEAYCFASCVLGSEDQSEITLFLVQCRRSMPAVLHRCDQRTDYFECLATSCKKSMLALRI